MANEVAKQGPNYFEQYGAAATQRSIVGRLLKFTKFGEYVAGQENSLLPIGTELVAYMPAFAAGFVRWDNNRPVEHEMGYVGDGFKPRARNDLGWNDMGQWETDNKGQPRDPWQFTNSVIFIDIHECRLYTFNTSSRGGLDAVGRLSKIYGARIKTNPKDLPTVRLDVSSYRHSNKEFGEIRVPVFNVVGDRWIEADKLPYLEGLPNITQKKYIEKPISEEMEDEIPF